MQRKNQEKVLLRGVKHQAQWKAKKAINKISKRDNHKDSKQTHFKSQLDRVYQKELKTKELDVVKKQARTEALGKSSLTTNIHKVLMSRYRK